MSKILDLNLNDVIKGGIIFILSSVFTALIQMLQSGPIDLQQIGNVALIATLSYIVKQLGTDDGGKFVGKF